MNIVILGRQPALGLAELESLYGEGAITPLLPYAALVDADIKTELGGSIKVAEFIDTIDGDSWNNCATFAQKRIKSLCDTMPDGKVKLGLSVFGLDVSRKQLERTGLELKKTLRKDGRSVRLIPNNAPALNSAQVIHNQLTSPLGLELIFLHDGDKVHVGRTVREQDIEDYTVRDRGRPMRDARVGMLPPKLAQIMIHLGTSGEQPLASDKPRLLDPFCGTGVVLQEAALMGYAVYGTDLSEKMIRYSRDNLNWLQDKYNIDVDWYLHEGDATNTQWQQPVDAVVCEGYLGPPLTRLPDREALQTIIHDCNKIMQLFLRNIAPQIKSGTPLCLGVPAWKDGDNFYHLPFINKLSDLGYERRSFKHVTDTDLLYFRDDQFVARELLVLTKT